MAVDYTKKANESISQYNKRIAKTYTKPSSSSKSSSKSSSGSSSVDTEYFKRPNESVSQYNSRVSQKFSTPSVITSDNARDITKENQSQLSDIEKAEQAALNQAQQIQQTQMKLPEEQRGTVSISGDQITYSDNPNAALDITKQQQLMLTSIDTEFTNYLGALNNRSQYLDASMKQQVSSINNIFEQRREVARETTRRNVEALDVVGKVSGLSRYAGNYQSSIITGAEQKGLELLGEIDSQEQEMIRAAKEANAEAQFSILNQQMQAISTLQDKKRQILNDIHNQAVQSQRLFMEEQRFAMDYERTQMELEEMRISQQVPNIFPQLQDATTSEEAANILRSYAASLNTDPSILMSYITKYGQGQEEFELEMQQKRLNVQATEQQMIIRAEELAINRRRLDMQIEQYNNSLPAQPLSLEQYKQERMKQIKAEFDRTGTPLRAGKTFEDEFGDDVEREYQEYVKEMNVYNYISSGDKDKFSANDIPANLRSEIATNITAGATMEQLINAYPEVSSSYLNSLRSSLKTEDADDIGFDNI